MKLADLFAGRQYPLQWYIDTGLVTRRYHPELPFAILNYTDACQFDRAWDLVTRNCRGLIYRFTDDEILARPFEKFFNDGEPGGAEVAEDALGEVTDKLDGSLGIIYPTPDGPAVATRGSFASEQALHATQVLRSRYSAWQPNPEWTYLVEIIY